MIRYASPLVALTFILSGCPKHPTSSPADAGSPPGPVDSGNPTIEEDSGFPPIDAGPTPTYGTYSCLGIANCFLSADGGPSGGGADTCISDGTMDAGYDFEQIYNCESECGTPGNLPDASGCIDALANADAGGRCAPEWTACENQGQNCNSIVECIGLSGDNEADLVPCFETGTASAINLGEILLTCVEEACNPDGGSLRGVGSPAKCLEKAVSSGEPCHSEYVACEDDNSENP